VRTQLWRDRVLHEAHCTADPVHLIRLFGIHSSTAVKCVNAAHPSEALPRLRRAGDLMHLKLNYGRTARAKYRLPSRSGRLTKPALMPSAMERLFWAWIINVAVWTSGTVAR
jgi:hypothetical protein